MSQTFPASRLLTSWKEIASFMGKGVRTVQRWEATLGLPIIRPADGRSGIVMARTADLEAWILKGRLGSRPNTDGWQQRDETARATFAECVRALRAYQKEVKLLCDKVRVTREELRKETDRLKLLCLEWDATRDQVLSKADSTAAPKVN